MKKRNTKRQKPINTVLRIVIPVALLALIAWGIFLLISYLIDSSTGTNDPDDTNSTSTVTPIPDPNKGGEPGSNSNTNTPDTKPNTGTSDHPAPAPVDPETNLKQATLEIDDINTEAGEVAVTGRATNITDISGLCTYTFTHKNTKKTITQTAKPLPNPGDTPCARIALPQSNFAPGTWTVKLTYKSNYSEGESPNYDFQIN